jgi:hypothetical protein
MVSETSGDVNKSRRFRLRPGAASRPTSPAHETLHHVADSILDLTDDSLNALLNLAYRLPQLEGCRRAE